MGEAARRFRRANWNCGNFSKLEDFAPGEAIEEARALGKMIGKI